MSSFAFTFSLSNLWINEFLLESIARNLVFSCTLSSLAVESENLEFLKSLLRLSTSFFAFSTMLSALLSRVFTATALAVVAVAQAIAESEEWSQRKNAPDSAY